MTKYAMIDHTNVAIPNPVIGWCDSDIDFHRRIVHQTPKESLIPCSDAVWDERCSYSWGLKDGVLVKTTATITPRSIQDKAASEMKWCHTQATMAVARKQTFTPEMIAYSQLVENIVLKKDTTALPKRPVNIFA